MSSNERPNNNFQEYLSGLVVIESKQELKHEGIFLSVEGFADIRFNLRSISFIDTFYGSNRSIALIDYSQEISKSGKFAPGRITIP